MLSLPAIKQAVNIPLLYVAQATTDAVKKQGMDMVGLLGTRFTMSDGFYTDFMGTQGVKTIVSTDADQDEIHRIIFDELYKNQILPGSALYFCDVISRLKQAGAAGIILGCTEICLIVNEENSPLSVFDSTKIHTLAAVDEALAG
jgi:aspartate racemase